MREYLPQIIASAIAIVLLPISKVVVKKLICKYGEIMNKSDLRMRQVKQVTAILLNTAFFFTLAVTWGLRPENLIIGLSSIFAILGVAFFAQWSILSNITAGVILFFAAPYKIGDRIHIIDKDMPIVAVIENIKTFYTYVRTDENEYIAIPNNMFLQKIVSLKKEVE